MKLLYLLFLVLAAHASVTFAQKPASARPLSAPPKPAAPQSLGEVRDGKFVSERFGITLTIPPDYTIISAAEASLLADAGADMMKSGKASDKKIDDAIGRAIRLLVIAEHPVGTPKNAAMEMMAVKQQAGITARMSLLANAELLKSTPFVLKRNLGSVKHGTRTFVGAEFEGTFNGQSVWQRMYVIMHRGYSVAIAITYSSEKQIADMEKVLATIILK